jgi:hypothetical protein
MQNMQAQKLQATANAQQIDDSQKKIAQCNQ